MVTSIPSNYRSALSGTKRGFIALSAPLDYLFLTSQHRVIAFERLFDGTADAAIVYPRVVVRRCLELNAAAVIFAHNYPSGICEPSEADVRISGYLHHRHRHPRMLQFLG